MDNTPNGLAALLGQTLGAQWRHLHPDIRARFTLAPGATRQRFTGSMSTIERSCIGWLIARLIAFMHVLPSVRARDVPCEFNLIMRRRHAAWMLRTLQRHDHEAFLEWMREHRITELSTRQVEILRTEQCKMGLRASLAALDAEYAAARKQRALE